MSLSRTNTPVPTRDELEVFERLIDEHRYDYERLVYIIFPFGQKGHALEHMKPYDWQMEELRKLSIHMSNPATRYDLYRFIVSSGNGAAKTSLGCMITMMMMYTQRLRARMTANTDPQMKSVVWPEMDIWFNHARYSEHFFEKFGTSIKAKDPKLSEVWRVDTVTWNEQSPASISGLHNKGGAVMYWFEEAPGIPANIWEYASGAFTETETIKLFMAFGNSDDPESKFEQNMSNPLWNSRRIDTRTLDHIDKKQIADWLMEAGGNEDHDDFRVRVRGLPRKTSKDAIIALEHVLAALERRKTFDKATVKFLPVIIGCDPAWQGGDETIIWYRQGNYACLLEKYKLNKTIGQDHMFTYQKLCKWERELGADSVQIDQGEGTALYTLANNNSKFTWELVSFASSANDAPDFKNSQYHNIRAQMYYECAEWLAKNAVLDSIVPEWITDIEKQLSWTKGGRHKTSLKKIAEPKQGIRDRVGQSPDVADGLVLTFARKIVERLADNMMGGESIQIGQQPLRMPEHEDVYASMEDDFTRTYGN